MLIGGIVAVLVAAGLVVGVLIRRRSNDDVHSVEHYHRKLHTLEEMRAHPAGAGLREAAAAGAPTATAGDANGNGNGNGAAAGDEHANGANGAGATEVVDAPGEPVRESEGNGAAVAQPASAARVAGSSTVRLTEADRPPPPLPPPPPLRDLSTPPRFGDGDAEPMPGTFMSRDDRAMDSINHPPRRLGGPLAAIAVVIVLVVILIVTGLHTTSPTSSDSHPHAGSPSTHPSVTATTGHPHTKTHTTPPTTPTTIPPVVSSPSSVSATGATYTVGATSYALALSATSGPCWVQVTATPNGSVLFSSTLDAGQSHTVTATGPVTVEVGAPNAFSATVNGTPVTLPPGYQAPFTMTFQTASGPGSASG